MAKNRKNQAAAIRFGPALKASFFILLIGGSAVGFVWQKSQIDQLGLQIASREKQVFQYKRDNQKLKIQVSDLQSPVRLDEVAPAAESNGSRQFAQRPAVDLTP